MVSAGNIRNSVATLNLRVMSGEDIIDCLAMRNHASGILAPNIATRCWVENNGGSGLQGENMTDCNIINNGSSLSLTGSAVRCTIAHTNDTGIIGGTIDSCVIRHNDGTGVNAPNSLRNSWVVGNQGDGVISADSVENSFIVFNEGVGVVGRDGPPYTQINSSSIRYNTGGGAVASGAIHESNLYGNGGVEGYDYAETRLSSEVIQIDLSGNYWGAQTTALMDEHPWGSFYNIPALFDFVDDTQLTEARYEGHLSAEIEAALPTDDAPAFLWLTSPPPWEPVNVGVATFTLIFSKDMNTESESGPSVTFGLTEPYSLHVVEPASGWVNNRTWVGSFSIQSDTGDGLQTLRVAQAIDASGFVIPEDTGCGRSGVRCELPRTGLREVCDFSLNSIFLSFECFFFGHFSPDRTIQATHSKTL